MIRVYASLVALMLSPAWLQGQQLIPLACFPVIGIGNFSVTHQKDGYGTFHLRFMAPHLRMTPPSPLNIAEYQASATQVTGPGPRPWVATGNWLGSCWGAPTADGHILILAKADAFLGTLTQVPRRPRNPECEEAETEEEEASATFEATAVGDLEDGESGLAVTRSSSRSAVNSQDPFEDCDEGEWPDDESGGGGDGPPPPPDEDEGGSSGTGGTTIMVCTDVEWFAVYEGGQEIYLFTQTYCEVYQL